MNKILAFISIFLFGLVCNYSAAQSSSEYDKFLKSKQNIKDSDPRFYNGEDQIKPYKGSYNTMGVLSRFIFYEDEVLTILISQVKDTSVYVLQNTENPDKTIYPHYIKNMENIDSSGVKYFLIFRISSTNLHQDKLNNFKLILKSHDTTKSNKNKKEFTLTFKRFTESDSTIDGNIIFDSSIVYTKKEVLSEETVKDVAICNFNIEIREIYHFQAGIGIFKSFIKSNKYEFITDIYDPGHGQKVVNNGNNTTYGATLGALIYPFGHDEKLLWDKDYIGRNFKNMIVFYIGIGLASKDGSYTDFFFGTGFSVFKLNFIAGVHYGREQHLQNGLRMDTIYPANTFGDISKYVDSSEKFSVFYSLILNSDMFTKFFK